MTPRVGSDGPISRMLVQTAPIAPVRTTIWTLYWCREWRCSKCIRSPHVYLEHFRHRNRRPYSFSSIVFGFYYFFLTYSTDQVNSNKIKVSAIKSHGRLGHQNATEFGTPQHHQNVFKMQKKINFSSSWTAKRLSKPSWSSFMMHVSLAIFSGSSLIFLVSVFLASSLNFSFYTLKKVVHLSSVFWT